MSGIGGIVTNGDHRFDPSVAVRMCESLSHRGPDSHGILFGGPPRFQPHEAVRPESFDFDRSFTIAVTRASRPFALVSTRLSVIELTEAGRQPMRSDDGSIWIAFNGEVYEHQQHRRWLESRGHRFRSRSDAEVVLRLYEEEGEDAFARLNGMFGLAIWDGRSESFVLARDRFGIKPLYYTEVPGGFAFASELKALLRAGLRPTMDVKALHRYLTFHWVPEPDTIVAGVRKVEPACSLRIDARTGVAIERRYWSPTIRRTASSLTETTVGDLVLDRLMTAVSRQTQSDVPVGALLSGSLDSSAIVALMVQTGHPPSCVHSLGFATDDRPSEQVGDRLWYARTLAKTLGLPYRETISDARVSDLLPRLVWHLDEPLADPAIVPTFLICEAARPHTKVLLSGLGATELLGRPRGAAPVPRDRRKCRPLGVPIEGVWQGAKPALAADILQENQYIGSYTWIEPDVRDGLFMPDVRTAINGSRADARHRAIGSEIRGIDDIDRWLYLDIRTYLPSHTLNYLDRMSMAASVEVRLPFFDNDLANLAFRLPSALKGRHGAGARILKRALQPVLPRLILSRTANGFSPPFRNWLRNDLREMVGDLLSPARVARRGLLKPHAVATLIRSARGERSTRDRHVWALLTLELWMQAYLDGRA